MDGLLVLFGTCFHECWVACILTDEETFAVMWHLLFHTCICSPRDDCDVKKVNIQPYILF
jgi:hypothetical protein